ncbi:hypothetical protein LIER_02887 [Lithospermum erythrorhizon]|uniref:Uncharacterized protein n=1 Tax=Lithospermum erythrorhizon TaxID=34254 RepID=A0AAV3NSP3_LITER
METMIDESWLQNQGQLVVNRRINMEISDHKGDHNVIQLSRSLFATKNVSKEPYNTSELPEELVSLNEAPLLIPF